jgi:hypothetical protein
MGLFVQEGIAGFLLLPSATLVSQLLMLSAGLAVALGAYWHLSGAHCSKTLKILLGDKLRVLTTPVPCTDASDINEAIRQHENGFRPISSAFRAERDSVVVNLILKNADRRALKCAIVTIGANLAFRPETLGATVFSPAEVSYDKQTIEPFKQAGLENYYALRFPITQPLTRICIWGVVRSKKMRPYLAVGCVSYRKVQGEAA